MSDEDIIKSWRKGLTVKQVSKEYRKIYNKNLKSKEKKITEEQAMQYVEPIIYKFETKDWVEK